MSRKNPQRKNESSGCGEIISLLWKDHPSANQDFSLEISLFTTSPSQECKVRAWPSKMYLLPRTELREGRWEWSRTLQRQSYHSGWAEMVPPGRNKGQRSLRKLTQSESTSHQLSSEVIKWTAAVRTGVGHAHRAWGVKGRALGFPRMEETPACFTLRLEDPLDWEKWASRRDHWLEQHSWGSRRSWPEHRGGLASGAGGGVWVTHWDRKAVQGGSSQSVVKRSIILRPNRAVL